MKPLSLLAHMALHENPAEVEVTALGETLNRIVLSGRLDTPGVDPIETHFVAAAVPTSKSAIVNLSTCVEFVSSMAIRMFISVARSMRSRQSKLALSGAQAMVSEVFDHVALSEIIPIVATETEAISTVLL